MKKNKLALAIAQVIGIGILGIHNVNAEVESILITEKRGTPNIMIDTVSFNTAADGFCSLVEAVYNANFDNNNFSDCAAGNGADIIGFSPTLNGMTITATNPLSLTSEITFDGHGADQLTLSGGNLNQIFNITNISTIIINGLSLVNGLAVGGGAINSSGHLTINNSILDDNRAQYGGAISSFGSLILNNVSMDSNESTDGSGGVIYHSANATMLQINKSSFTRNISNTSNFTTQGGAAISIEGPSATISQSSFVGNSTNSIGGAIHHLNFTTTIINSTFSNNYSRYNGGSIVGGSIGAVTRISNSTFSRNLTDHEGDGASIYTLGTLSISNSILAGNGSTNECIAITIDDNAHNLIQDGSCSTNSFNGITGDPMLLPLAESGGFSHMPMVNSPVIDTGSNIFCTMIDQLDVLRPIDGDGNGTIVCDIGAVEIANPTSIFRNSFED